MDLPKSKKIVLFDGVCNLCNSAILTTIKYDKKNDFVYTALSSKIGKEILTKLQIDPVKTDSIILYDPNIKHYTKSSAALKIMTHFGGIWNLSYIFWIVPKTIRDSVYDFIAKNRYKWFGKKEQCMIPTPELKAKFLE